MQKLTEAELDELRGAVAYYETVLEDEGRSSYDLLGGWNKVVAYKHQVPRMARVDVYERGGGWAVELVSGDRAVELTYIHPQLHTDEPPVMSPAAARNNALQYGRRVAHVLDVELLIDGRIP